MFQFAKAKPLRSMFAPRAGSFTGPCVFAALGIAFAPSSAWACSTAAPVPFVIDPNLKASDSTPPTPFLDIASMTARVNGEHCQGNECSSSSCGSSGALILTFESPHDSQSTQLGYRVVWLSGAMPLSLQPAVSSVRPLEGSGALTLELGFDEVTRLDGDLALIAVDQAGNESAPSEPVHVEYSGCTSYFDQPGCIAAPSCAAVLRGAPSPSPAPGPGARWALPLLAAVALAVGRFRRRAAK
jgi:hypothetical protein